MRSATVVLIVSGCASRCCTSSLVAEDFWWIWYVLILSLMHNCLFSFLFHAQTINISLSKELSQTTLAKRNEVPSQKRPVSLFSSLKATCLSKLPAETTILNGICFSGNEISSPSLLKRLLSLSLSLSKRPLSFSSLSKRPLSKLPPSLLFLSVCLSPRLVSVIGQWSLV